MTCSPKSQPCFFCLNELSKVNCINLRTLMHSRYLHSVKWVDSFHLISPSWLSSCSCSKLEMLWTSQQVPVRMYRRDVPVWWLEEAPWKRVIQKSNDSPKSQIDQKPSIWIDLDQFGRCIQTNWYKLIDRFWWRHVDTNWLRQADRVLLIETNWKKYVNRQNLVHISQDTLTEANSYKQINRNIKKKFNTTKR